MANGEVIEDDASFRSHKLLDGTAGNTDGVWVDAKRLADKTLITEGTFTASVEVRGSNDETVPANSAHGQQLGSTIAAAGVTQIAYNVRWMKCRVTGYSSGTINANLHSKVNTKLTSE